ncbi:hypothetical protein WA577_006127 [Blastocystis sp. JDR]
MAPVWTFALLLFSHLCGVTSQTVIENSSHRIFAKPLEVITLDVFLNEEYIIYVEDLKENTNYSVKLSYPGVIPVQYEVFLEEDDSSPSLHRSVHQRRIQDTRLLSFRTDERSRIVRTVVEEDGTSHSEYSLPILHIIPKHLAEGREPEKIRDRYATLVVEPVVMGMTPSLRLESLVLIGVGIAVLYGVTFYYHNPAFRQFILKIVGLDDKKTD